MDMKECRYEKMAHLYPAGALSNREKAEFEAHVKSCETCAAIVKEVEDIRDVAIALGSEMPLDGLDRRIMNGITMREQSGAPGAQWEFVRSWQKTLAPLAAAACLFLFTGVMSTTPRPPAGKSGAGQGQVVSTADTGRPSEYMVLDSLDSEGKYLVDDGDAALSSYFNHLMQTN